MAIKKINFSETDFLDKGSINFSNNNIVTVIGMNGSGKTIMMENIKDNFKKEWFEQIILKKDFEEIKNELNKIFSIGTNAKNFKNLSCKIKKDELKKVEDVREELDNFIWGNMISAVRVVLSQQMNEEDVKNAILSLKESQKTNYLSKEIIIDAFPKIEEYCKIDSYVNFSKKTDEIFDKIFGNPRIITVDDKKTIKLEGYLNPNKVDNYSAAQALRDEDGKDFLVRILRQSGIDKKLNKVVHGEEEIEEKDIDKINDWFSSYVSQNIKIMVEIEGKKILNLLYREWKWSAFWQTF